MGLRMLGSFLETRLISKGEHDQCRGWTRESGALKCVNPLPKAHWPPSRHTLPCLVFHHSPASSGVASMAVFGVRIGGDSARLGLLRGTWCA